MVVIDSSADGDPADLAAALLELGAVKISTFRRVVSARLPIASIPKLADIASLRFARPALALTRVGATTSQGDAAMNADDARTTFAVDGTGVTVGVLSDSTDCGASTPGDYATDVGTADLPPGVAILDDSICGAIGTDEGRGIAQLVYDVAPGAKLSFHTAAAGKADFALGIEELAGCPPGSEPGCAPAADKAEVIVDDIGYPDSPMFQDGIIAQAVDVVAAAGVTYFSAAGNSARASWEGMPFDSSGITPFGYPFEPSDAHDFDPGAGVDIYQAVTFPPGMTTISFQWDQPFASVSGPPGATTDMDICIYPEPAPGAGPMACEATSNDVTGDPIEVILDFDAGPGGPFNIAIVKYTEDPTPDPGVMKYVAFNPGFSVDEPYPMASAGTLYGQNNAAGAIAVGAAFYFDTPEFGTDPALLEAFSSAGGTPILFDTAGAPIATEVRLRPQIVAPDGTNTTFFGMDIPDPGDGSDADTFPNFFSTSAAAPHAAGVAALMRDAFFKLTPAGVEDVLIASARDMGAAGFDFDSGFGLIDGEDAVGTVHDSTSCDGVADLELSGTPNTGPGTFSATTSITWKDGTFDDIDGYAPTHIFADGFESGDTSSWSTACF